MLFRSSSVVSGSVGYTLMAAAYEGLLLAHAAGIEPSVFRHVLEATDMPLMLYTPFNIGGPAPPVTYTVDGTQYIGFATRTHFMALKIGGTEKFPEAPPTPGRGAPKGPPPAPPAAAPKPEAELHGNDKQ